MAFKFNPSSREFSLPLPDDASIEFKIPYAIDLKGKTYETYAELLCECVTGWKNVEDKDGKEFEYNDNNRRLLFANLFEDSDLRSKLMELVSNIKGGFKHT